MSAFDALRHIDDADRPDQRFAAQLKIRVATALTPDIELPKRNETMTTPDAVSALASPTTSLHPYLAVHDAAVAIDWYTTVLHAAETIRYAGDDGRIGHAELDVDGATIMISDEYPDFGATSPRTIGGTPVKLYLEVPDVDAVWSRALANGADGQREPADQAYGRRACAFGDPFGHQWMVQSVVGSPNTQEIEDELGGDFTITTAGETEQPSPVEVGYVTFFFADTDRARTFYGELFGWQTVDGHSGPGFAHIANTRLPMGMAPRDAPTGPELFFAVDDAAAAAERVVALGGEVVDRTSYPDRGTIHCLDDQGQAFTLLHTPSDN